MPSTEILDIRQYEDGCLYPSSNVEISISDREMDHSISGVYLFLKSEGIYTMIIVD